MRASQSAHACCEGPGYVCQSIRLTVKEKTSLTATAAAPAPRVAKYNAESASKWGSQVDLQGSRSDALTSGH
jgi:hypothetical protein